MFGCVEYKNLEVTAKAEYKAEQGPRRATPNKNI